MPETREISVITQVNVAGSDIEIVTSYNATPDVSRITEAFISDTVQIVDGINFIEGQGGLRIFGTGISGTVNSLGELVLTGENEANYSIDSNGNLTYTE